MYVTQTADLGIVADQNMPSETPEVRGTGGTSGWDQYGE